MTDIDLLYAVLIDINWTVDSKSPKRGMENPSKRIMTCDYGSNPSCKLLRWKTAGMLLSSNLNLSMRRSHSTIDRSKAVNALSNKNNAGGNILPVR